MRLVTTPSERGSRESASPSLAVDPRRNLTLLNPRRQIGHLHQVHHMWQYDDLEARKARRAQSWEKEQWSSTVARTAKLCSSMNSQILKPLPFSPLR